jgi:hypothetical protein
MKHSFACTWMALLLISAPAIAFQTAPTPPAPAMVTPAPVNSAPDADGKYKLRDGDDVALQFAQDLSSKTSTDGDSVALVLAEDLKVGSVVVARAGAKAVGEVTNAHRAGMMGKAGELNMRFDYLKVGDYKVHLRGSKGKEGESGTTSAVVLTVLFGPIGLIKHGKEVDIKQGTAIKAYVADDISLPPTPPPGQ